MVLPKVMIYDVPNDISEEEVRSCLIRQNPYCRPEEETAQQRIKIIKKMAVRDRKVEHWVLECVPEVRDWLMSEGRVYIDWSSCICLSSGHPQDELVRAKKTSSQTQSKQLTDMTQDVKIHLARVQAKFLQLQGKYLEQSQTINKLLTKGSRDVARIQETIVHEVSKLSFPKAQTQMPALSYATIPVARSGKAQEQQAKTRVLLVYPKEEKKEQTSEETKIDLQTKPKPKQMKLQVNRLKNPQRRDRYRSANRPSRRTR